MSKQYPGGLITKTPVTPTSLSASGIWSLSDQAKAQATNTWPFPRDPQFNYVTMLLHGDGSAGVPSTGSGAGASSTVTNFNADASTNNFNVTINGDARSDNFTPYQEGYYSNRFDGSGDYLTVPNNAVLNVGSSTFTLECWFFNQQNALSGAEAGVGTIASKSDYNGSNSNGYSLFCYDGNNSTPSTNLKLFLNGVSFSLQTPANAVPFNTWTHVAVVKSGTTVTIYCNGVSVATSSSAPSTINDTSTVFIIGSQINGTTFNGTYPLSGLVSNLRLVKGTAVYTAAFTPPTAPLTAITNTSLLTCQSNRFIDNSTNAFTITKAGDTAVSPAIPFTLPTTVATYGSGYFDGNGDYLDAGSNSAFAMGSGNYTLECWVYVTSASGQKNLFCSDTSASGNIDWYIDYGTSNTKLEVRGGANICTFSYTPTANTWTHLALVRSGTGSSQTVMYANGVSVGSATDATNWTGTGPMRIGAISGAAYMTGYMTDSRIVKGTAVYSTTFTPPTTPLTAITNTSLLTTQYNGGGNNSGFKDSSQFNFPITRNGNTTQGTFTPYGANWSNYFDGDGDGITTAVSAGFAFGTGDFTYEAWYYSLDTGASQRGMFDTRVNSSSTGGVLLREDSSGFLVYVNGTTLFSVSGRVANTWQHIALVRQGSTIRFYINGVQSTSASSSQNFTDPNCRISGFIDTQASPYAYLGYISNARVVKGTCLYPSGTTFTPSITPLTAISGTSLLTCQGNRFFDASSNALTITVNGSPSVQRFSPFAPLTVYNPATNGGSGYFDGSGDYLTATLTGQTFGTGNFTAEGWFYQTANVSYNTLMAQRTTANSATGWIVGSDSGGSVYAYSNGFLIGPIGTAIKNQWNHIAFVRSSGTMTLYLNGVSLGTSATSKTFSDTFAGIGGDGTDAFVLSGYASNVRYVVGTAIYTAAFTPPTAPLTAVTGTSLLVSTTNAGILDNSMMNNLETVGNAAVSTSVKKYGAASMYFDGTGDYLISNAASSDLYAFGTGDFTIEFWLYLNSTSSVQVFYDSRPASAQGLQPTIYINASGTLFYYTNVANRITGSSLSTNTWYHIAVARSGTSTKMFVNGTQVGSTYTDSTNYVNPALRPIIGADGFNSGSPGGNAMNGYIDDLRITKGYARYTANFTAPDQAFPNG